MFLNREYRGRAIGLAAAYAVLVAGIVFTRTLDLAPASRASMVTSPTIDRPQTTRAEDFASAPRVCTDTVC